MIKIGMVINDRYEIIEKIGTGGMSDVYKALDSKLNRNVAVKVLKQEFGDNENFVSKFRVEAQAAAGLMHPNIVNVYDVGEEGEIHYIVMELVEGITLKKYIEKKARLTYKEAVSIAIQVSLGIEAAHGNHIIHRDIKPQNIIISRDGKVKVTDFGIAKAATSNTITSNVMGSVHYTSPEQARGGYSDEKSDIYSLGISMFEMLTGRVPFNGETTVAIAIKHIQEAMPSCREYVPEIPQCVESIIFKCTEKSPDRRYQNMQEVIKDLKQALLTPEVDFVDRESVDKMGGTRVVSDDEMAQIKNTRLGNESTAPDKTMTIAPSVAAVVRAKSVETEAAAQTDIQVEQGYEQEYQGEEYAGAEYIDNTENYIPEDNYDENAYEGDGYSEEAYPEERYAEENYTEEGYEEGEYQEDFYAPEEPAIRRENKNRHVNRDMGSGLQDEDDYNPKIEKITTIVAIAAGVIIVGLIVALLIFIFNGCFKNPGSDIVDNGNNTTTGSSVVKPEPDAEGDNTQGTGSNNGQPTEVKKVSVPTMVGRELDDVKNELYALGLKMVPSYEESDTIESGKIISANHNAGEMVDEGTVIELVVSSGTNGVKLPDVSGKTYESAANELTKAGFKVSKREENSSTVEEGYVISQEPEASDSVPKGSEIILVVSKGKKSVKVPNLLGLTEEEATLSLVEAGLKVGNVTRANSDTMEKDRVCQQSVNGTYLTEGSTVDIVISLGSAAKTYKYENVSIEAPTTEEQTKAEALYTSGSKVKITLTASDGKVIIQTEVTSFPFTGNYYGIPTATGVITLTYTGTKNVTEEVQKKDEEGKPVVDENGNPVMVTEPKTEQVECTITRNVTFVEETPKK